MTIQELQDWLLNEGLRPDLDLIAQLTAAAELSNVAVVNELRDGRDKLEWQRILLGGSILARSFSRAAEEAALRIATAAITLSSDQRVNDAGAILFDKLSNNRAVQLAERKESIKPGLPQRLGVSSRLEVSRRQLENAIIIEATGELVATNRFQREFWRGASEPNRWISASAPTASGKTYVVLRWLIDQMTVSNARVGVYLAPTRALVAEIEENLISALREREEGHVEVTSLPLATLHDKAREADKRIVFVLTQERLHLLSNAVKSGFSADILVVDEAHKVGDTLRGVILQDAIERLARANPKTRTVFLSPATQNPALLLEDAPLGIETEAIDSDTPTVIQNVILASQVSRKPTEWALSLRREDTTQSIGVLKLPSRPTNLVKKIAFIAAAIAPSGGTLVYANGAAEAEDIAFLIGQIGSPGPTETSLDLELKALADLARKGVHRAYLLAPLVERGVAFHYGNMPSLIRTEIERLFRSGKLRFLVCTSTLIEGVNLSCRTIVVRGPRKGRGKPMEPHDFWNLAGRAGRWGDEFQGNIVCIDPANPDAWPSGVPARARYPIRRETDAVMRDAADLRLFIERRWIATPRELLGAPQFEQVSAYLITTHLRAGSIADAPFAKRHDADAVADLDAGIRALVEKISFPSPLAEKHPGVSAAGMQRLLSYFERRKGDVEELLPAPPESDDAYSRLIKIMYRINAHLYPAFLPEGLVPLHALIATEWMRGLSLAAIIAARIRYHRKRTEDVPMRKLIRDTMELVEQTARFRAPKYISAYMDVLELHLKRLGRDDLISEDINFGVMLEFGLSTRTLISLMELGLSRMSAVALYEKIARDDLDQEGCRAWVRDVNEQLDAMDIPSAIVREVRQKVLGQLSTKNDREADSVND